MTKDQWIQKAKALLFDYTFDLKARSLKRECNKLIEEGGGYNYEVESSETPLVWKEDRSAFCKGCAGCITPCERPK